MIICCGGPYWDEATIFPLLPIIDTTDFTSFIFPFNKDVEVEVEVEVEEEVEEEEDEDDDDIVDVVGFATILVFLIFDPVDDIVGCVGCCLAGTNTCEFHYFMAAVTPPTCDGLPLVPNRLASV